MSTQEGEATNVKVMVRVRPFNSRELALENPDEIRSIIQMDGNTVTVLDAEHNYQERDAFEFDECFWSIPESQNQLTNKPFANQVDVFEKTGAPAVENALRGYHNTIFAYGQTGSGKTHSMLGNDANEGIAPRLVRHLFARIAEERKLNPQERVQYSVELSFLEIYNEKVKDLLLKAQQNNGARSTASSAGPVSAKEEYAECRVRQHPEKGTFVEGLMRMLIESEEQCLHAIKEGMEHRAVTSTLMNDTSSRSHAIFQICLTQKSPLKGTSRVSIINLVDLAGSERVKMSGVAGQAFTEAKAINQSLSTLRRVIDVMIDNSKLKKGQRAAVPPYRESLLTWVLSDSLGGNSRTVMVAAVSPFSGNMEDTIGTLRYALKAKAIVCHAKVNEEKTAAVVHALRSEMETLRKKLEEKQASDAAEADRLASALKEREEEWTRIQDEAKRLDALKAQYEQELSAKAEELSKAQRQMQTLDNVEEERRRKEQELAEARTRQEATARQLAEQQAERMRRDAELQAVMARKASLEANHDRSAVEEARAKLEIEQARMRQFANAFQNAFVLGKQKSGLEDLKQENIQLRQRLTDLEVQAAAAERDLAGLTTEKQTVERKVELLDRKCQAMLRDLQAVMRGKNERIDDLTARKEAVSTELDHLLRELARKQSELAKVRTMHSEETIALTERVEELHQQQQQCEADSAVKAKRLSELREQVEENRAKLEELRHALSTQQAKAQELSASVDKREAIVAELRRQREAHVKQRDEARQQLGLRRAELDAAYKDLTAVKDEVEVLQRNHKELRSFVTSHFFPAGQAAPRVAPLPPSAESYASPAPSSRRFVTGTSPAPHSPRAGTAPSSASHASSPASVAVRQYTNRGVRYEVNTPSGFATASATTPKPRR